MGEDGSFVYTYIIDLLVSFVCAVSLMISLSLDAWKAFKRKAYWFPGEALVLSAPTIQLLSFIDKLNSSVHSYKNCGSLRECVSPDDQLAINTARIMICVIIGYLLPGMVRSSFTSLGSNTGALALSVIIHMASEVYFFQQNERLSWTYLPRSSISSSPYPSPSPSPYPSPYPSPPPPPSPSPSPYPSLSPPPPPPPPSLYTSPPPPSPSPLPPPPPPLFWFWVLPYPIYHIVSWATLFTVIILLVFLLTCAVLAGKIIRNIISRNVPLALSCCCNSAEGNKLQCDSIGDHVFKCWIVVRASQPDYIMARSVFSSFVGFVVTVSIVFLAVDWIQFPPQHPYITELIPLVIQFVFILIGWIIIILRWLTGVMYFSRDLRFLFHWEDFWTRSIVEMKANLNAHDRERLFREKRLPKRVTQESGIASSIIAIWLYSQLLTMALAIRLYSLLLTMALCLQKLMVLLSKASWCLSEIVVRMIRLVLFSREKNAMLSGSAISPTEKNPFIKYQDALEIISMPGEIAGSLWTANESAFKQVKKHMEEGIRKGNDTPDLIKFKEYRTEYPHDEAKIPVEGEEYFQEVSKTSWKMKAVSLIRFMMLYYEDAVSKDIDEAIQAYCQAWPLMDLVDTSNPEANFVSLAADKEFNALEDIWKKHLKMKSVKNSKYSNFKEQLSKLQDEKIKKGQLCQLCDEGDLKLFSNEEEEKVREDKKYKDRFHDQKEWLKSTSAKISLYKTRKALELNRDHSMDKLKSALANVIFGCIDREVDKALIKNCNEWAKEVNENEIFELAFIAGIAQSVKVQVKAGEGKVQSKVEVVVHEGSQVSSTPDAINEVKESRGE